jgi:glycosyltransferase involved in cell wall biosynthesis/Tfp pilus assembly protein PilF
MTVRHFLFFHKDHPLNVSGCNSGAENATLWLAKTLAARGASVVVAGIIPEGTHQKDNVQFLDLGRTFDTRIAFDFMEAKGKHFHLISACRALPILESRHNPLCLSRGFIAHDPSSGAAGITPVILSDAADYMVCVSQAQKNLFVESGAKAEKIIVIPNGADLELFKKTDISNRDLNRFVFVGALVPHKGIDILLQAIYNVSQEFPDVKLDVYGSSALWGEKSFVDEANVEAQVPQIKFHGAVSQKQIAAAFGSAAACIIPSRWFDSFPLTAVESLVTGCPVIAFDVGGIREAVQNDVNGILIPEVSEASLTSALRSVLSNKSTLTRYSEYAAEYDRKKFTWDNTARQLENVIDSLNKDTNTQNAAVTKSKESKVGVVTTWNQACGLATYASFMTSEYPENSCVILAEETDRLTGEDGDNVIRCWNRKSSDYEKLKTAIEKHDISIIHLNCHARFFQYPSFSEFIDWCHARNAVVVATMHSVFTLENALQSLLPKLDKIFVHCKENIFEAVANGADPDKVFVVNHGVVERTPLTDEQKQSIRQSLNISTTEKLITCFGFVQPHKGMDVLIQTIGHLRGVGVEAKGLICGMPNPDAADSVKYQDILKQYALDSGVSEYVIFLDRFVSEEEVANFLGASDVVIMNYQSKHFEASGACSLAIGANVPVVTSIAPTFNSFDDAVFRGTSGFQIPIVIHEIVTNPKLNKALKDKAKQFTARNNWSVISKDLINHYKDLGWSLSDNKEKKMEVNKNRSLKVLLHNRPNTFTQRGGDTVVIEKLLDGLKGQPVDVTIDLEAKVDPKGYDIVHIFNFALPDMVRFYAERAKKANVPYVVTTLLEDVPNFHYQSHFIASQLLEYVAKGQIANWYNQNKSDYRKIESAPAFDNKWAAMNAAALFPNGATEAETLKRTYGSNINTVVVPLGSELKATGSKEEWVKEFGFSDFVLCVGRLETRKNQLMLLKALENDDITVVLAGGGFSYQADYEAAVKGFKRKGKTIVLPKLSDKQLANAYAAAKVHALPSWYELPGLVSLEAAHYGCNIVATRNGTSADYLGDDAFYCDPGDADSIRSAVLAAFYAPRQTNLKEKVMNYSWKEMADKTMAAYQGIANIAVSTVQPEQQMAASPSVNSSIPVVEAAIDEGDAIKFQESMERGEIMAADHKFEEAIDAFSEAYRYGRPTARLLRAHGATLLASGKHAEAKNYFERAVAIDSNDAKSWCGLGMCAAFAGDREEAYKCQVQSLKINPENTVSILQLMECSYFLNRYTDLERILRDYIAAHPNDSEMEFCLAGCLYKAGNHAEATAINNKLLAANAAHAGAVVLAEQLAKAKESIQIEVERTPQPKSDLSSINGKFLPFDQEILEVEECKRKNEFDNALSRIAKLMTETGLVPSQIETIQCLKAEVLVLTDKFVEAESIYNEVLAKNSSNARALCGKGALAAAGGNWSIAKANFQDALNNRPEYDVALSGLGLCAAQNSDYETAWNFYTRSLNSNGENVRALLGIIEMGYALKRLPEVETAIKRYLDSHPADLNFMYSLAGCCFAQGKVQEAIDAVNTITLFEPTHKNALELKSMIDRQLQNSSTTV